MREVNVVDSLYPAPQNAVTYEIRASTDVLALTAAGVPKSVSISASLYKSDGQNVGLCADFNAFLYVYDAAGNLLKSEQLNGNRCRFAAADAQRSHAFFAASAL